MSVLPEFEGGRKWIDTYFVPPSRFIPAVPRVSLDSYLKKPGPLEFASAEKRAGAELKKDLGVDYDLIAVNNGATIEALLRDLDVQERLDSMIDRCLKRLLFVRGVKSLSNESSRPRMKSISASKS